MTYTTKDTMTVSGKTIREYRINDFANVDIVEADDLLGKMNIVGEGINADGSASFYVEL